MIHKTKIFSVKAWMFNAKNNNRAVLQVSTVAKALKDKHF